MISYHPDQKNIGKKELYFFGFRPVDTDDTSRIAKAACNFVLSPIIYNDGKDRFGNLRRNYRHTSCFKSSNWIGLDFDEGITLAEMTNTFCDVTHVIGTTKSHQKAKGDNPPCDRFRIFLKLPITVTSSKEYKDILRYYVDEYGADRKCIDAARFFWPCKEITSINDDGETIDIRKKEIVYHEADISEYAATKTIPPWVKHWLEFGAPQGSKNEVCLKVSIWLTKCGFSHGQIIEMIMQSPIPNRHDRIQEEVFKTTLNGIKIAQRESKTPQGKNP